MEKDKRLRPSSKKLEAGSLTGDYSGLTFGSVLSALSSSSVRSSVDSGSSSIVAEETLRLERRLREAEAEIRELKDVNRSQRDRIQDLEIQLRENKKGCSGGETTVDNVSFFSEPSSRSDFPEKNLQRSSTSAKDIIDNSLQHSRKHTVGSHPNTGGTDSRSGTHANGDAAETFDRDLQNYYETRCRNLEKMVLEMHRWFSDYDLVWVGDKEDDDDDGEEKGIRELTEEEIDDYNQKNADLNLNSLVASFPDGDVDDDDDDETRGKDDEDDSSPILDLFWFANGLKISTYPFMRYDDSAWGRQTLEEISEGFLPSRLQFDFPDGVDLRSKDRRNFVFPEETESRPHPSVRELQARGLLPSVDHPALEKSKKKKAGSFAPVAWNRGSRARPKSPTSKYLERVPRVVIGKDGDIHRPREDLEKALAGRSAPNAAIHRRIPVRIRAYHRRDAQQVLRLHLLPEQTVDEVKAFCETKLGVKRGEFDANWELVSDMDMKTYEMEDDELFGGNVVVWKDGGKRVGDIGWSRPDVDEDAAVRDKMICLHLRRK